MDIRERIKKMASGEIDLKEYTSNYEKKLKQEQEEKRKQETRTNLPTNASSRRKAYNTSESTKAITNSTSSSKVNLPVANEFKKQLETGKRVDVPQEYSLPVFVNNVKKNAVPTATKIALPIAGNAVVNKVKNDINDITYIGKRTGTGVLQGTVGIAQAGTTEVANNLEKGKEKSAVDVGIDFLNSINGIMNPVQTLNNVTQKLPTLIGNTIKTVTDKDKNAFEKAVSLGTNAVSEGVNDNPAKKIVNAGTQLAGKILPSNASEEVSKLNDKISQPVEKLNAQLEAERNNYGKATQVIGDVGQVVGNMVPSIVGTAITKNPTVGLATMGLSTKGQATQEALNKGATLDEAIKIGDTKAVIEVGTEMLTGGVNIFGKGALDDIVERGIVSKVKNNVAKKLTQQGINVTGEILEETISDVLGTTIDKGTVDPNASYSIEDWGDTALTTVLSTLVLNAIGGVGSIKTNKADKQAQQKLQEAQDLIKNVQNEPVNTQTQQITQQENKVAQNGNVEQIKIDSENFAKQVDAVRNGTFPQRDMLVLGKTPQVLKDIGLPDLPITMTQKHLDTIMNESGKHKGANYHNLGIDIVKQLPEAINNPLDIVKSNTKDDSIVLTTYLADKQNRTVIASIKIDGTGKVNDIEIDSNVMTSAYGRNNYEKFMEDNIKNGNLLYDIDRGVIKKLMGQGYNYLDASVNEITGAGLQLSRTSNSNINNSITSSNENVKPNNYNMPNASNNIQNQTENLNSITNIEDPKTAELPNNDREKVKQNKVAKILSEPVKNQKPTQRTWAILQANLIDKGAVFETLSLKTGNRELQAKYDATLSSGAKGQYAIGNDRYIFENGKKTLQSKSLASIIDEVGENETDFYNYMYHQLNIDRMTLEERFNGDTGTNYERKDGIKNKPVFGEEITAEYSKQKVAEYEEQYPEFKSYAQDVYDFLDANKKELVDSGVISQELSDKFKEMYPHYVPIARVDKSNNAIQVPLDTNRTGINNPIKKATGGSKDIQPMFHTIADRTLQTYRASARNAFGVELKNTLENNNILNSINEDTDIDTIIDTMADEQQTGLTEGTKYKNPTFTVFENGKKVTYDINQDMYDALKPQNELITKLNNSLPSKIINKVSNIRRGLLTEYNPLFSITNSIKDGQDILQNSQHAGKTYKKLPEAYSQIVQKGYWYNEYIQNGGEQNSYFKDGNFKLNDNLPRGKYTITIPIRAISKMNNIIEMAPRLAEYIVSRENGSSVSTSMLDASRVTTNFKAGGDITKFLNRNGVTFLNAGVQGMAQQIRNLKEANAKGLKGYAVLATKTILAGAPALILNNLIWDDDDDYEELQDYVKDNYYIVGKIGDNQFIRIPKGRTTAVIQKLFTTADKYLTKGKEINIDNFAEDFWANLLFAKDNIAPNNPIDNNIASPIAQVLTNKTWYGEDLIPTRLQDVPKAEQYDETTDKFSKWVGEKLNISPIKINYLLDQYGGGISDVLLPSGTPQAENNPIEDKFTTNSVMKSKYPGEFFEKVDELKVNSNSINATDEDELKYKYISSISKETSDLYKKKREIQNSTLKDEEKKKQLIEVQKQINSLAKEALEKVDTINIKGNTATIGGREYYKTTDVKEKIKTWKKLSDEEIEKNKNISLTTYTNYKEKIAQETIKQRKTGDIKEDGSLKDKDKMSILINSMYSNKEKQALYENYIKEKEDSKYDIIKTVNNFNINSYLEYKIANSNEEFKADRKDDGTLSGKTISGSAKNKKFNYISNMKNTPYMQKAILFGLESTPDKSDKAKIVNYITSLSGKTNKEKLEMLDQFTWVTIYKDGSFRY